MKVHDELFGEFEAPEYRIEELGEDEPVPMVAACHTLHEMEEVDDGEITFYMRKIAYRPAGRVRTFLHNIKSKDRESWSHWFTEFAKNVDYANGPA